MHAFIKLQSICIFSGVNNGHFTRGSAIWYLTNAVLSSGVKEHWVWYVIFRVPVVANSIFS